MLTHALVLSVKVSHRERHTVELSIQITCMKVQEVITINSTLDSGCFTDVLNLPLLWRNQDLNRSPHTLGVLGWSFEKIRRLQTACLCGFPWSEVGIIYLDFMESHALTTNYLTICPLWRWPESTRVNLLSTIASRMAVVYSKMGDCAYICGRALVFEIQWQGDEQGHVCNFWNLMAHVCYFVQITLGRYAGLFNPFLHL